MWLGGVWWSDRSGLGKLVTLVIGDQEIILLFPLFQNFEPERPLLDSFYKFLDL